MEGGVLGSNYFFKIGAALSHSSQVIIEAKRRGTGSGRVKSMAIYLRFHLHATLLVVKCKA